MIMRPALLEEYWNLRRSSSGSGDPDKPSKRYPCYETARKRYILSPPQPVGEPFLLDYMAYHSLRSEEHTSELQSLMRISYAVFCLKKKKTTKSKQTKISQEHTHTPI